MNSLAISDHGVMFGVMDFYWKAKKAGIKPIIGLEAYVAPKGIAHRTNRGTNDAYHLLLLAKNLEGYKNLCKLSSIAALEGYYYKPRLDHDLLRKYSGGLIATSTCLGSEVCSALMDDNIDKAREIASMYADIFGQENYFIELQDHGLSEQKRIKEPLIQISKDLGLSLIATNDVHYLCRNDAKPHDVLLCIQTGSMVKDTKRMKFETEEFYIKSPDEMAKIFADTPEAIENTLKVADMCDLNLEGARAPMPQPNVPLGLSSFEFLKEEATRGLSRRIKNPEACIERLDFELGVIQKTGFEDYFLLVKEFAQATRERGIYYGVRGSAAGSLVSYCIGITDVDPVEYDLTFERFLNPERISMPDIDMDFEDERRDEMIQYVTERFGADHVAQIVTFGTLGARAAIRDCARVMGYLPQDADKLCKLIPGTPGMTLDQALSGSKELKELIDTNPVYQEIFASAKSVEGIARHAGVHAAGVVITREPLVEYVPLYRGSDNQPITAYTMSVLEKLNLLKMDFLGLSNLTVLAKTLAHIRRRHDVELDLTAIPTEDKKTFDMLGRGETVGVFQLEGAGMTRYVTQLKPASIRELSAMIALFRPGPVEYIPDFIDSKFGRKEPEFLDERMRPVLEETYGVIVYQDQVLKLVQTLAGFSLGKADVLRRAMGKKDAKALVSMHSEFMAGGTANGITVEVLEAIWKQLVPFAGYAFNKAHAVCYGILAYQTAYLKANYPVEYMAGLLEVYRGKEERVINFIEDCRRQKIQVLPPDINKSLLNFTIENDRCVRFGLVAIKGVGEGIGASIIAERESKGNYGHLYEFAARNKSVGLSRTNLEPLVKAGAFDSIDRNRARLILAIDGALSFATQFAKDREEGQDSLFQENSAEPELKFPPFQFEVKCPTRSEMLRMEKEVIGLYVSDHPLRGHEYSLSNVASNLCIDLAEFDDGTQVHLAGVLASIRVAFTRKNNEKMATAVLEDLSGQVILVIFAKAYERFEQFLEKDSIVAVKGVISYREDKSGERLLQVRVDNLELVQDLPELEFQDMPTSDFGPGSVHIEMSQGTDSMLQKLNAAIEQCPGDYSVHLFVSPKGKYPPIVSHRCVDPNVFAVAVKSLPYIKIQIENNQTVSH